MKIGGRNMQSPILFTSSVRIEGLLSINNDVNYFLNVRAIYLTVLV